MSQNRFIYTAIDFTNPGQLQPQSFKSRGTNVSLFPFPQPNSVGTNDIGNAIAAISFHGKKIDHKFFFRNAVDDVGGSGIFMPVIRDNVVGFAQVRRFMLYDFLKHKAHKYRITMSITEDIEKVTTADATRNRFIFQIARQNSRSNNPWDFIRSLHLMELNDELEPIKEIPNKAGVVWSVVHNKNFLYDMKTGTVDVLDMNLNSADHPLAVELNKHKQHLSYIWIHVHPYLPFAILSGGDEGATWIAWGDDKNKPHLLADETSDFSFSPDGKWVVCNVEDYAHDDNYTYIIPVSEKYPNYLGSPIRLLDQDLRGNHFAWTTNPVSLVGSYDDKIYRWDLTNETHPESDKATFHDYIVGRDLERMAREKRQGLGEKQN